MAKLCFIDIETGGLEKGINPILQLAGMIEIDGEIVEEFNYFIQPFEGEIVEDKALEVNKIKREAIASFHSPRGVHTGFVNMMDEYIDRYDPRDKFHFVGYNCRIFDSPWLRKWFEKCGDKYFGSWFFEPSVDMFDLWSFFLINERSKLKNFKLFTVAEYIGVEIDESLAHDALYDIKVTKLMFEKLKERFNLG